MKLSFKKLVCGVLACTMAAIPVFGNLSVSAANVAINVGEKFKPDGWGYWREAGSRETVMDVVNDVAYSGSSSIRMNSISGMANEQYWLTQKLSGLSTGEYTLSLMVKGDPNHVLGSKFRVNTTDHSLFDKEIKWIDDIINNDNDGTTKTDMGDGWYRITFPVDASGAAPTEVMFSLLENNSDHAFYIDDISLTLDSDATHTNVLTNGSFERYTRPNTLPVRTFPTSFAMEYNGTNAEQSFDENNYFTVANGVSYTGNNSLMIKRANLSGIQYILKQNLGDLSAGDYTLSLMIKNNPNGALGMNCKVFPNNMLNADIKWAYANPRCTRTDTPDGWSKFSFAFKANEAPTVAQFEIYENNTDTVFYIDDITLTKDGDASKTNLITNGSFEDVATMPIDMNPTKIEDYTAEGSDAASLWQATLSGSEYAAYSKVKAAVVATDGANGSGEANIGTIVTTSGDVTVYVAVPKASSDITSIVVKAVN